MDIVLRKLVLIGNVLTSYDNFLFIFILNSPFAFFEFVETYKYLSTWFLIRTC